MSNEDWKWKQSSRNAFSLIKDFFSVDASELLTIDDEKARSILKQADDSSTQLKRIQDTTKAIRKTWKNQLRIGTALHGLVREGLGLITQQRRQESETTKQYAKAITDTRVLSAKTTTAVERTYEKGKKQVEQSGKQLNRTREELDSQYQVIDETATTQSQQRIAGYRDRAQKRLEANKKPWRNY